MKDSKHVYGEYSVSKNEVGNNSEIDLLKAYIKASHLSPSTGWYARKVTSNYLRFMFTDDPYIRESKKYLKALEENGWEVVI